MRKFLFQRILWLIPMMVIILAVMFVIGRGVLRLQPVITIMPAIGIILISLAFSFLGDALRDAFDPHNQTKLSALHYGKNGTKVKLET